ncbi:MAG: CoA pyrophosphatase [Bacteroidales bacterium]|jgi:8-oxo-dGTP pyrophosphatase MutT (NUDIX family)
MDDFANRLKNEILKGLPGTEIQWQMASSDRMVRNFPRVPGKNAGVAAVLILLFPENGSVHTVFMQRPDYNGVHSGQISFPGGKKEPTDENIIQTAIREANEETGVDPEKISIIGTLTPLFIPISNMIVTPVIGWVNEKPVFNHQPEEVVFLIDADLKILLDPSIIKTKPFEIRGEMIEVKYFDYEANRIWGATAMILYELLIILRRGHFLHPE